MLVEVTTSEDFYGDVIGDLNRRRGSILGMESRGTMYVVRGPVGERRVCRPCVERCDFRWHDEDGDPLADADDF